MIRIIYGAPPSNTPAGGVKVIYRHSEIINSLGYESGVWHPNDDNFKCTWFENNIRCISTSELSPNTDFLIIPEIWASTYVPLLKSQGFRVAIFVQNCYYTHVNLNPENVNAIEQAYQSADLILSISKDTSDYLIKVLKIPSKKIFIQRYSIDQNIFHPRDKSKTITYMPRKMGQHSARVISALKSLIPKDWNIVPLDNMKESDIAASLGRSIIFLAFSEFEGLPVPPVEAALSGNIVIGYHGQGGKEYWESLNFIEIQQGDIKEFIHKVLSSIDMIDSNMLDIESINSTINYIGNYFSKETETKFIKETLKEFERIKK